MILPGSLSWLCSDHKSECVKCTLGMLGWSTTGSKKLKKTFISLCAVTKLSLTRGPPQPLHQRGYASSSQARPGLLAGQESMVKATRILVWGWVQNWDNKLKVLRVWGNLVGDVGFLEKNKTVGRISLLELGLQGWDFFFSFFHFKGEWGEGRVWGRVWRGNPQHNSQSKDNLNEKEGNYYSYAGNSQITLHSHLGSLYWILYPPISNMSIQCSASSSAVPQLSPSSFCLWDVLFIT